MRPLLVVVGAVLLSCSTGLDSSTGSDAGRADAGLLLDPSYKTSYSKDIEPLVRRSCTSCHSAGGIAPFALDTPAAVVSMGEAMAGSVKASRMPPFFADPDCNTYQNDPRWTAQETALFEKWLSDGKPLGNEADRQPVPAPKVDLVRNDINLSIDPPFDIRKMGATDNYHCFVLDPKNTDDVSVLAYQVKPGNGSAVHHVLAYSVPEAQVASLLALDAQDPGPGYPCMAGGVGVPGVIQNQIASWVPGARSVRMPDRTGLRLQKNGRIVMQIHYNLTALAKGEEPFDQTSIGLEISTDPSLKQAKILPMLNRKLDIAPNDPNSVQISQPPAMATAAFFGDSTVYSVTGHMHSLGKSVKLEITRTDGSSQCLLHIPAWDFNWQQAYAFSQPFGLKATDALKITCTYDNTAAKQPVVNGVKQQPRQVGWGENTTDEMCMTYMLFVPKN